jgi:hypothetical protein
MSCGYPGRVSFLIYAVAVVCPLSGLALIVAALRDMSRPARIARREARHLDAELRAQQGTGARPGQ